tara:strand:- start:841 stop:2712 length:1872 start_codon:yes stop_codon:yes gene_type:complete
MKQSCYDVVVVGGGHAGTEAAFAASRIGVKTALITFKKEDLGQMSCNPAMGGLGKGHLIKEIDALGGMIGLASDMSGIQFRMLNQTKGAAVRGPRAQIDRKLYKASVQKILKNESIDIIEDEIIDIGLKNKSFSKTKHLDSVDLLKGGKILCKCLIITTGTFLRGTIYCGEERSKGGRIGSKSSQKLSNFFIKNRFKIKKLKTGTPPRILSKSINFKKCLVQKGDQNPKSFSALTENFNPDQVDCHITRTNAKVHKLINDNIQYSPMYNGLIQSKGPRYCPSIEDKVRRFSDKESHQIFLEPETKENVLTYPNGVSTALPKKVQEKFLKLIPGLENIVIDNYGYAIEYDSIDSSEIFKTYETKKVKGLYLAGQINGSTGYEEASGQGILAGINAAKKIQDDMDFILSRSDAYLGVLTDDLSRGGLEEPYRMFTSRAEYRLLLRADNADERLTDKGIELGLACKERKKIWQRKKKSILKAEEELKKLLATPKSILDGGVKINQDGKKRTAFEVLGYINSSWSKLKKIWPNLEYLSLSDSEMEQLKIKSSYHKYIDRQSLEIKSLRKDSNLKLKENIIFSDCPGLSNEAKEILSKTKPASIAEASILPGMTPAATSLLLRYVKKM